MKLLLLLLKVLLLRVVVKVWRTVVLLLQIQSVMVLMKLVVRDDLQGD